MKVDFISQNIFDAYLKNLISKALEEDTGNGDHTTLACIPENSLIEVRLLVKDHGIIAGVDLAEIIFHEINPAVLITKLINDGSPVEPGDIAFTAKGPAQSIITAERLILNFMQHLSGIASKTNQFARLISQTGVKLLDTRKTTPGLRLLEKWAVKTGGGFNHRIGLYDMILIKDNHVDFAGGITNAVNRVKKYLKEKNLNLKIELEVRNFNELNEALGIEGIDIIMLDNFSVNDAAYAVKIINKRIKTEASGNIREENILDYALSGVDYISSGALTNSVRSLDFSLKMVMER